MILYNLNCEKDFFNRISEAMRDSAIGRKGREEKKWRSAHLRLSAFICG